MLYNYNINIIIINPLLKRMINKNINHKINNYLNLLEFQNKTKIYNNYKNNKVL